MMSNRNKSGESLVSVVVAALLIGLIAAAIGSLAVLSTSESAKLQGRVAGIDQARVALDRIGRLVRMARTLETCRAALCPLVIHKQCHQRFHSGLQRRG